MDAGGAASRAWDLKEDPPLVDALTGFGSRQALLDALSAAASVDAEPTLLVAFGLDGFDEYVSLFGSLAARKLLLKLAARLVDAIGEGATCYRPRQDEFAALVRTPLYGVAKVVDPALVALRTRAATVAVSASWGAAMLPEEATDPVAALELADARLASNAAGLAGATVGLTRRARRGPGWPRHFLLQL